MPTSCFVYFDNDSGVFSAGQNVSGTIKLTTVSQKTIRAIYITVFGRAKVLWRETRTRKSGKNTVTYTVTFTGEEIYLNSRTYVAGRESGPSIEFNPGTYTYNFSCLLPQRLPTSYVGEHGKIEYYVMLTIDRPFRFDNVFKQGFTVIYNLDLNIHPMYRQPELRHDDKTFCCCCCETGPLKMTLTTPITGYVPGQLLLFTCLVENEANTDIEEIVAGLKQEVRFTSTSPHSKTKSASTSVAKKHIGRILRFNKREYKESLAIPSIPQSTQDTCRCIQISYYLYVKAKTGLFSRDLTLTIPITIGAIPIYEIPSETTTVISTQPISTGGIQGGPTVFMASAPQVDFQTPDSPLLPTPPGGEDLPPSYSTLKPPSYREAVVISKKSKKPPKNLDPEEQLHNSGPFVPKYPNYDNFTPSAPPL